MSDLNPKDAPVATMFFSIGFIGMDESVTQYIDIPLADLTNEEKLSRTLAQRGQIAQMRLQIDLIELLTTHLPPFIIKKYEESGWDVPEELRDL